MMIRFTILLVGTLLFTRQSGLAQAPKITSEQPLLVSLPAGTPVLLRIKRLKKEQLELSDILHFEVSQPVSVHGALLIRAGAMADCRLKKIEPQKNGCDLILTPETVEAIDGRAVLLKSAPIRCFVQYDRFDTPVEINTTVYRDISIRTSEILTGSEAH
ncbi:MAG: hypothetical protein WCR52_18635 [Bacteroidota bacterium]